MSNKGPKFHAGTWFSFLLSAVAILLAVFVLVSSLINTVKRNSTKGVIDKSAYIVEAASNNLKPIGISSTSDAPVVVAASTTARSGKEVYTAVCAACHNAGVAGAPKLDDKAAWEPRVATGLDALMATAINGKGAMPPRAGQNVGDEELKATILYMTKEAGFDLGGATSSEAPAKKAETAPVKTEEPLAKKEEPATEPVNEEVKVVEAPAAPKEPESPKKPSIEKAEVVAAVTTAAVAVVTTATAEEAKAAPSGDGAALYTAKGCGACHGADAKKPIMPLYPKIAGQSKVYVTTQMTDIKTGKRSNGQSVVMKGIMAGVSDAEITAIAEYLSNL